MDHIKNKKDKGLQALNNLKRLLQYLELGGCEIYTKNKFLRRQVRQSCYMDVV